MAMEFFNTHISPSAIKNVTEVLRSTRLSEGTIVKTFELGLSKQLSVINPVLLNSGTSALHLALVVSGVGSGDEIILPAQTFIATGSAILMQSAKPVFADIQLKTGNIDPESIRKKITPKTKAIIPVHWAGYPCDMDQINKLAEEFDLAVIEDAAHALGASYKNKPVGTLSRFTAFSFQAIKHLTTGDGGALCCMFEDDYKKVRTRRWFGIDRDNSEVSILGERQYDVKEVGYKYHMNDLSAAVGLGNLDDFPLNLERRRKIAKNYRHELAKVTGLNLLDYKENRESSFWLFTILVEDRINFIKRLNEHGIPVSVVHQRIDRNSVFGGIHSDLPSQTMFDEKQISIPVHSGLSDEDVIKITTIIKQGW